MTEAIKTLSANPPAAEVITMARYLARKRVKDELRASGLQLQHFPADIQRAAQAYLEVRKAELIAEAKAILCAEILTDAQQLKA